MNFQNESFQALHPLESLIRMVGIVLLIFLSEACQFPSLLIACNQKLLERFVSPL